MISANEIPGVPATNATFDPMPRINATRQTKVKTATSLSVGGDGLASRFVLNPPFPINAPMLNAMLAARSHTIAFTPTGSDGVAMSGRIPAKHQHRAKNAEGCNQVPASARMAPAHAMRAIEQTSAAVVGPITNAASGDRGLRDTSPRFF